MYNEHLARGIMDSLIALLFVIFGVVFIVWPIEDLVDSTEIASWQESECIIDHFWFEQPEPDVHWELHVQYYYRYQDRGYASEKLSLGVMDYISQGDAAPLVSAMTPGAEHSCYVNPDNPHEAILFKPNWQEMFVWWTGLFFGFSLTVIGLIGFKRIFSKL